MKLLGLGRSITDDPHTSRVASTESCRVRLYFKKAIRRFIARSKISHIRRESKRKEMHIKTRRTAESDFRRRHFWIRRKMLLLW